MINCSERNVVFMKVVLLAGGYGSRISEESYLKPKPMIEIGYRPIIWHIMKLYSYYGFNDFIICCGYKGHMIKEYFVNYYMQESDVTVNLQEHSIDIHGTIAEPWKVTLVNTGIDTMTGSRIKQIRKYIGNDSFMLSYGDGVSNVNIKKLLDFHKSHGKTVTITSIQQASKFGVLCLSEDGLIQKFSEKPKQGGNWINGGFAVCENDIFQYIDDGDQVIMEREPFEKVAREGQMMAYKHKGFWHPMDTMTDKRNLEAMWLEGNAPWKVWQ